MRRINQVFYIMQFYILFLLATEPALGIKKQTKNIDAVNFACKDFDLVGDIETATVFLFGEHHPKKERTVECALAIASYRRFITFSAYLEGAKDKAALLARLPDHPDVQKLCNTASECDTWEEGIVNEEQNTLLAQHYFVRSFTEINQLLKKFANDDKEKYFLLKRSMREKTPLTEGLNTLYQNEYLPFPNLLRDLKLYWFEKLVFAYENRDQHSKKQYNSFFDIYAAQYEKNVRKEVAPVCANENNFLKSTECNYNINAERYQQAREDSLSKKIAHAVKSKKQSFFIAGRNHIHNEALREYTRKPKKWDGKVCVLLMKK